MHDNNVLTRLYVKTFTSLFSSTSTQWALINLLQLIAVVVYPKIANYSLLPKLIFVHKFDCRDESSHPSFVAYLGCFFFIMKCTAPHHTTRRYAYKWVVTYSHKRCWLTTVYMYVRKDLESIYSHFPKSFIT